MLSGTLTDKRDVTAAENATGVVVVVSRVVLTSVVVLIEASVEEDELFIVVLSEVVFSLLVLLVLAIFELSVLVEAEDELLMTVSCSAFESALEVMLESVLCVSDTALAELLEGESTLIEEVFSVELTEVVSLLAEMLLFELEL